MSELRACLDVQTRRLLEDYDRVKGQWQGRMDSGDISVMRAFADEVFMRYSGLERDHQPRAIEALTIPTRHGDCAARRYYGAAEHSGSAGCALFLHGGGWSLGSLDAYDGLAGSLAALAGIDIISLDYALAPEHPFPVAMEQVDDVLAWLRGNAAALHIDGKRLGVMGDSAGGALAAVAARRACLAGHSLAAQALIYPMTDVASPAENFPSRIAYGGGALFLEEEAIEAAALLYVGAQPALRRDADVSPLLGAAISGLAPALVVTAEYDPLRDEGREYYERLKAAGISAQYRCYDQTIHGFVSFGVLDCSQQARRDIAAYLQERLGGQLT